MARTAEKTQSLIDEDPTMEDAVERVLRADGDGGAVQWADVNDTLTSGQWGRLIETGVLVEAGDGFRLEDPEAVRAVVGGGDVDARAEQTDGDAVPDEPPGDSSWSTWDKAAGLLALSLFPGYYFSGIRDTIGGLVDVVFGPVDAVLPFYAVILVLAVLTGLYSTILQANLMDMETISYYQQQMKEIQQRQEAARERGDDEELEALREEQMSAMGDNLGMFKEQFRPMAWIMLLTIPVFLWMYWMLREGHVVEAERILTLPLAGEVALRDGIVGPVRTWLVWYFLCSMAFSQIIRKSLNVQTTPT